MILSPEWFQAARLKYEEISKLVDEKSEKDPSEPYKHKYEALKLVKQLESDLNVQTDGEKTEFSEEADGKISKLDLLKALISYESGVIYLDTEELSVGEEYLRRCWEAVRNYSTCQECCLLAIYVLNHLGIVWSGRSELQKAREYLTQAESIYSTVKKCDELSPLDLVDFFCIDSRVSNEGLVKLEKAHTHTLYYLAQIHEHLGESQAAAMYCHATLKRQIRSNDYHPIDWSVNCATLSQYFIATEDFTVSKHYLACASFVLNKYGNKLKEEQNNESEREENWDAFCRAKANIAKCWVKYGLLFLAASHDKNSNEESQQKKDNEKQPVHLPHVFLQEPEVIALEEKYSKILVSDYEEARLVFLTTQDWLKEAKEYFTLNDHSTDYVKLVQDTSRLYKLLSLFETNDDRQCKMLKRRADMLEETSKALNPQYYLLICRQLTFELAEIYSEMMTLKSNVMQRDDNEVTAHAIKKHNMLACRSIQHYEAFINYLKDSNKKLPNSFSSDVARPALIAFFCLGRLYAKIITSETEKQLENLTKSEKCYKFIIKYIEKNPDHEHFIKDEIGIVKEMVQLLPGKMQSVISSTLY